MPKYAELYLQSKKEYLNQKGGSKDEGELYLILVEDDYKILTSWWKKLKNERKKNYDNLKKFLNSSCTSGVYEFRLKPGNKTLKNLMSNLPTMSSFTYKEPYIEDDDPKKFHSYWVKSFDNGLALPREYNHILKMVVSKETIMTWMGRSNKIDLIESSSNDKLSDACNKTQPSISD